jgi:pyrroloquinoline quinone biosynthesis protein B
MDPRTRCPARKAPWLGLVLAAGLASAPAPAAGPGPFVLVLGTAQDGGIPQLGAHAAPDAAARRDPSLARTAASLLVVDPASGRRWLIDATPDVARQLDAAEAAAPRAALAPGRAPIVDGVFLTHAHVGHYLGLAYFGREVYGADRLPVHGSARMADFLARNAPWELLVRLRHVELRTLLPGRAVELAHGLSITPFLVPHRDEYTDTFGFEIRTPSRALLYIPDIDKWERWGDSNGGPVEAAIARVDVALLDATFFGDGEIPGRSLAEIPHPFVVESIARFAKLPASERKKIVFTHLNHSNRAALPDSEERRAIEAAGMRVAREMERIELGAPDGGDRGSGAGPRAPSRRYNELTIIDKEAPMSPNETSRKPGAGGAGPGGGKPPRKSAGRAPAAPAKAAPAASFETAFAALGRKADDARARLSEMTDEGARSASRTLQRASRATQVKVRKLNADWKRLPPKKKAQVLAGVLSAIAAAVAVPLVVRHRRKVRARKSAEEPTDPQA